MMSLSFYWALAVSQFFDVKRKDFWQMFVHHICTICLLSFSWICNFHRIGTLVLLIHDCGDIFLEVMFTTFFFLSYNKSRFKMYQKSLPIGKMNNLQISWNVGQTIKINLFFTNLIKHEVLFVQIINLEVTLVFRFMNFI